MKIAILGTRGIPNHHGGFEQFAEFFSVYLARKGHEVFVYNSSLHPFKEKEFQKVNIIHCKDWEDKINTAGQFIYDLNCILDSRKRQFDVILQLGYTSSSIWYWLLPKNAIIITNMDGLEWKRSKYPKPVQRFLKLAEKLAVKSSNHLISDSKGIKEHLKTTYNAESEYIAYGAEVFRSEDVNSIQKFNIKPYLYNMLIARLEPENNIETILNGVKLSNNNVPFLVIGKHETKFGEYLKAKFKDVKNIIFMGAIYDLNILNNLRFYSNLYFHGHSVGGTNPSLLEAMASSCLIVAHNNVFNKAILEKEAFYFQTDVEIKKYLEEIKKEDFLSKVSQNVERIEESFTWDKINKQYLDFINKNKK